MGRVARYIELTEAYVEALSGETLFQTGDEVDTRLVALNEFWVRNQVVLELRGCRSPFNIFLELIVAKLAPGVGPSPGL